MDWDKLIPGHPGPGGRLGNDQDVENLLQYMADLATEVKKVADDGKCYDTAMKEVKLPKYESSATTASGWPATLNPTAFSIAVDSEGAGAFRSASALCG